MVRRYSQAKQSPAWRFPAQEHRGAVRCESARGDSAVVVELMVSASLGGTELLLSVVRERSE